MSAFPPPRGARMVGRSRGEQILATSRPAEPGSGAPSAPPPGRASAQRMGPPPPAPVRESSSATYDRFPTPAIIRRPPPPPHEVPASSSSFLATSPPTGGGGLVAALAAKPAPSKTFAEAVKSGPPSTTYFEMPTPTRLTTTVPVRVEVPKAVSPTQALPALDREITTKKHDGYNQMPTQHAGTTLKRVPSRQPSYSDMPLKPTLPVSSAVTLDGSAPAPPPARQPGYSDMPAKPAFPSSKSFFQGDDAPRAVDSSNVWRKSYDSAHSPVATSSASSVGDWLRTSLEGTSRDRSGSDDAGSTSTDGDSFPSPRKPSTEDRDSGTNSAPSREGSVDAGERQKVRKKWFSTTKRKKPSEESPDVDVTSPDPVKKGSKKDQSKADVASPDPVKKGGKKDQGKTLRTMTAEEKAAFKQRQIERYKADNQMIEAEAAGETPGSAQLPKPTVVPVSLVGSPPPAQPVPVALDDSGGNTTGSVYGTLPPRTGLGVAVPPTRTAPAPPPARSEQYDGLPVFADAADGSVDNRSAAPEVPGPIPAPAPGAPRVTRGASTYGAFPEIPSQKPKLDSSPGRGKQRPPLPSKPARRS